jgi:hypothetical protein
MRKNVTVSGVNTSGTSWTILDYQGTDHVVQVCEGSTSGTALKAAMEESCRP